MTQPTDDAILEEAKSGDVILFRFELVGRKLASPVPFLELSRSQAATESRINALWSKHGDAGLDELLLKVVSNRSKDAKARNTITKKLYSTLAQRSSSKLRLCFVGKITIVQESAPTKARLCTPAGRLTIAGQKYNIQIRPTPAMLLDMSQDYVPAWHVTPVRSGTPTMIIEEEEVFRSNEKDMVVFMSVLKPNPEFLNKLESSEAVPAKRKRGKKAASGGHGEQQPPPEEVHEPTRPLTKFEVAADAGNTHPDRSTSDTQAIMMGVESDSDDGADDPLPMPKHLRIA